MMAGRLTCGRLVEERGDSVDARILIADDEEHLQLLLKNRLEAGGYECLTAMNGIEAVDLAEKHHPNLILMDLMMPEMNGYDAYKKIKSNPENTDIKIIFFTFAT